MTRKLTHILSGTSVADGDGVQLRRYLGTREAAMLDPFLLLDFFEGEIEESMSGGFPAHPHRGFETVTYMLAGRIRHKDSTGNEGLIEPGGVQWMTAGRGVIHSEMPESTSGKMKGIQLWINLPADAKMVEPRYQGFDASDIPAMQFRMAA